MPIQNDYLAFLARQRQTRTFAKEPVSDDDVASLLETMRWTGSASNSQPWQFLVVRDPSIIARLAKASMFTFWVAKAPLVLVVIANGADRFAHAYDIGRLDERVLLASQALGLGAGIFTFGSESAQRLAHETLGVPDDRSIYSAVAVGHPAASAKPARLGGRKPLANLVHWDRFGVRTPD